MRVAVPSDDGETVAQHFGRSAAFLVFEIENGEIRGPEARPNRMHASPAGECASGGHHDGAGHSHAGILAVLADCEAVLCGGMGSRAANELAAAGIAVVMAPPAGSARETVAAWLSGSLEAAPGGFCRCHH